MLARGRRTFQSAVTKSASLQRDAVIGIGRDIGCVEGPERRVEGQAAAKLVPVVLAGRGVQEAQPPAKNMVRPLARFGVYAASVPAGTVAGNRHDPERRDADRYGNEDDDHEPAHDAFLHPGPMTSLSASYRGCGHPRKALPEMAEGGASRDAPPPPCGRGARRGRSPRSVIALLEAIGLVAATAILLHVGERGLEACLVLHLGRRVLGVGAELGEPGLDVVHLFPDRGQGRGIAASLRILGNRPGIFAAASWYCAKIACALARSNGSSPS